MGAREELYAAVMSGGYHSPERSERASACIDAYRAEVLREARKEILAASFATPDLKARELWKTGYKAGLSMAAVICTPLTP